jgi:probable F420-dependent oxidoreductase
LPLFGLSTFVTGEGLPVDELARTAEGIGLESLWVSEHSHIPVSRDTPWPTTSTGGAQRATALAYDPFVALSFAAAATTELRLGTAICQVTERDPIATAKAVATLDQLSNGRVLFGVGAGWNREELANHGTRLEDRFAVLRERVDAMSTIWANEVAEYDGEHVRFTPLWSWPKPAQQPRPPVLLGAGGTRAVERVLDFADGWLPIDRPEVDVVPQVRELHALAAERGRPTPLVALTNAPTDAERVHALQEAGVDRFVFRLPPSGAPEVRARLVEIERFIQGFE